MKYAISFLLLLPIFGASQDKIKFVAGGVTCSMCSNAIHKSLKTVKGVKSVDPNLETQEWNIEYEKNTYDQATLIKKVEDSGFSIEKLWVNGELKLERKRKPKKHEHDLH